MTNIVVFGKPRAFESYEYVFDGKNLPVENTHREPILKPEQYEEPILHYFVRDSYAGLEYYTRVKGFESERDGIVFGVSMKSSTDFNIIDTILNILQPFWVDFASALLNENNKFVEDSIINRLKGTQWSQSEIDKIQSTSLNLPIKRPQKNILLLVSPELGDIKLVEHTIKEYADVYVSANLNVFKDQINDIVLKEAGNQIFKIQDAKIEPLAKDIQTHPRPEPPTSVFVRIAQLPVWGKKQNANQVKKERNNQSKIIIKRVFWLKVSASTFILAIIVIASIYFWPKGLSIAENQTSDGQNTDDAEVVYPRTDVNAIRVELKTYNFPIYEKLHLNPRILPDTCTQYYPSDISFEVSDPSLVHIDKKYNLIVDNHPDNETKITIKAYIKKKLLGEGTYMVAKKRIPQQNSSSIIPPLNGSTRTLDQYIADLEKALTDGSYSPDRVISECQKIINSKEYYFNSKAITLRDKAQRMKDSKSVESAF